MTQPDAAPPAAPPSSETTRLWGGRFRKPPSAALMRLSSAASQHSRLIPHDIAGCIAHAGALSRAGLLEAGDEAKLVGALETLRDEVAAGIIGPEPRDEDIHTFIERVLTERLGTTGGKLRAGRSRNDQAANDLKLYLRAAARGIMGLHVELMQALAQKALIHAGDACPGFTHLQCAQPVTFGHLLLAHAQPLLRDASRLMDWHGRAGLSPLGAAAMAGSALVKDPERMATELGYDGPCENSIDAVGARDHVAEFLFVAAMLATNLSRLAEEATLWASRQFGWIGLDDAYATGSSIMPQKKNPDIAEISRGRAARLTGDLVTMLGALKGLPLSYNRDLAEDKRAAFDACDVLSEVLPAMAGLIGSMQVNVAVMGAQAGAGFALATEVADYLSRKGVPFAEAHEITGLLVRRCEDAGTDLESLDAGQLAAVDPRLGADLIPGLSVSAALAARDGQGGTAPQRVREQGARFIAALAPCHAFAEGSGA
jgi:argininosuccinate lyase